MNPDDHYAGQTEHRITFRISPAQHAALTRAALTRSTGRGSLIRQILAAWLDDQPDTQREAISRADGQQQKMVW